MTAVANILLMFIAVSLSSQAQTWPPIQEISGSAVFAPRAGEDSPFETTLFDLAGTPQYRLECHNGDYDVTTGFNFSGVFQCAVFAIEGNKAGALNLLADGSSAESTSDWANRARLLPEQLQPPCASWKEYGAVRHFRLRGMVVTMTFTPLEWNLSPDQARQRLGRFRFDLAVARDDAANSPRSERVAAPRPPKECGF